jgi:hypothetical protein
LIGGLPLDKRSPVFGGVPTFWTLARGEVGVEFTPLGTASKHSDFIEKEKAG